jgi:hypothetical protein
VDQLVHGGRQDPWGQQGQPDPQFLTILKNLMIQKSPYHHCHYPLMQTWHAKHQSAGRWLVPDKHQTSKATLTIHYGDL